MEKLTHIIIIIAGTLTLIAGTLVALDAGLARQDAYAAANDCRYESGICYTYEQRGYLWADECRADKACRESWGL